MLTKREEQKARKEEGHFISIGISNIFDNEEGLSGGSHDKKQANLNDSSTLSVIYSTIAW